MESCFRNSLAKVVAKVKLSWEPLSRCIPNAVSTQFYIFPGNRNWIIILCIIFYIYHRENYGWNWREFKVQVRFRMKESLIKGPHKNWKALNHLKLWIEHWTMIHRHFMTFPVESSAIRLLRAIGFLVFQAISRRIL